MSINMSRLNTRIGWGGYVVLEIVLFLVANLTSKSSSHPGTVSNVFFTLFIAGLVLAVALIGMTFVGSRKRAG